MAHYNHNGDEQYQEVSITTFDGNELFQCRKIGRFPGESSPVEFHHVCTKRGCLAVLYPNFWNLPVHMRCNFRCCQSSVHEIPVQDATKLNLLVSCVTAVAPAYGITDGTEAILVYRFWDSKSALGSINESVLQRPFVDASLPINYGILSQRTQKFSLYGARATSQSSL